MSFNFLDNGKKVRFLNFLLLPAGLGSKLRFIFRLSLSCQIQNHFSIKQVAEILSSSCSAIAFIILILFSV
jgi:hypothetical protein